MRSKSKVLIALGANREYSGRTPVHILRDSLDAIHEEHIELLCVSKWYLTPAFPVGSGPDFVNGAILAETGLSPNEVVNALHRVEARMGRTRDVRWEARVCDLDLVAYERAVLPNLAEYSYWRDLPLEQQMVEVPPTLIVPHPRLQDRAFVLVPLRDVTPDWVHPVSGKSIEEMIAALPPEDIAAIRQLDE